MSMLKERDRKSTTTNQAASAASATSGATATTFQFSVQKFDAGTAAAHRRGRRLSSTAGLGVYKTSSNPNLLQISSAAAKASASSSRRSSATSMIVVPTTSTSDRGHNSGGNRSRRASTQHPGFDRHHRNFCCRSYGFFHNVLN